MKIINFGLRISRNIYKGQRYKIYMFNKKGLSSVVANVLIVLLAVAAVGILMAIILPTLQSSDDEIKARTNCLNMNLKVVSCSESNEKVTVSRGTGGPDIIDGVRIIVEGEGTCDVSGEMDELAINDFSTANCDAASISLGEGDLVTVGAMIGDDVCEIVGIVPFACDA